MADVVGYSRLMGQDEERTVSTLRAYRKVFTSYIPKFNGRVVDAKGDAVMAEFATVTDAIACAAEIQREIAERNEGLAEDRRMQFRIGINLGEVLVQDDEIYGDGVNIAARLETLAEPGGICVSRAAHDQAVGKLPLQYEYLGEHSVKNIVTPVRVYRVLSKPGDAAHRVDRASRLAGRKGKIIGFAVAASIVAAFIAAGVYYLQPPPEDPMLAMPTGPSIAVLPFVNMSGDPEQEYFADGITETLITDLAKLRELVVIASNSVFTYKGKSVDVRQVGQELGVRHILEGSVQKAGDRVRITAQLIEAATGVHLWAERYDRPLDDIFAVQDEITRRIVTELDVQLVEGESARIWRAATSNVEAYDATMRAYQHLLVFTREDNARAGRLLEKAIALDPEYAFAYAGLANKEMVAYRYGWGPSPQDSLDRAALFANTAISLDPELGVGYSNLAYINFIKGFDRQANELFEKSMLLNPNGAFALVLFGITLMYQENLEAALEKFKRVRRLSPVGNPAVTHFEGETYRLMGRHAEAIRAFRESLKQAPNYMGVRVKLICAYVASGRSTKAREELAILLNNHPDFTTEVFRTAWAPKATSYRDPEEIGRMAKLLREAGLP